MYLVSCNTTQCGKTTCFSYHCGGNSLFHVISHLKKILSCITASQHNKTVQPKAVKCPTSHFSPFNCCCFLVCFFLYIALKRGFTLKFRISCFGVINSVLFNFLCKRDDKKLALQSHEMQNERQKRVKKI